jgi:hypothetical protein
MPLRTILRIAIFGLAVLPLTARAEILTIHDLADDPKRYDGQLVTVRAVADFSGRTIMILFHSKKEYIRWYDNGPMSNAEAARACITVDNNGKLFTSRRGKKAIQGRTVTVRGIFEANMFGEGGEGIQFSGCDVNYRLLTVEKVLRVDP